MGYEWDAQKEQANTTKHGIDFKQASQIFANPVCETVDARYDYGETRYLATGEAEGVLWTVVYTWRGENRRIISARRANKDEREAYRRFIPKA